MTRFAASALALALAPAFAFAGNALAQTADRYDESRSSESTHYDYGRVLRVDPVLRTVYRTPTSDDRRCYSEQGSYASRDGYGDDRYDDRYRDDRYGDDRYRDDRYRDARYGDGQYGTETGRNVSTVLGGVLGAVLGSKIGDGSGRYASTAIGTMVGGMAGREIYENVQRNRSRTAEVRVCDPEPASDRRYDDRAAEERVEGYDVTYEYGGRQYVTRTDYHPGDRIRVRVDVRAE